MHRATIVQEMYYILNVIKTIEKDLEKIGFWLTATFYSKTFFL